MLTFCGKVNQILASLQILPIGFGSRHVSFFFLSAFFLSEYLAGRLFSPLVAGRVPAFCQPPTKGGNAEREFFILSQIIVFPTFFWF